MAFALSVILFIVALFAIVMIHEGGHYLAARGFNFRVLEYFVGFGPRLWSFRRGEIEYGVKAIPAGGTTSPTATSTARTAPSRSGNASSSSSPARCPTSWSLG